MTVPKLSGLNCPNCGASIEMRTFGQAITVVCQNCKSIVDPKDPNVAVLRQAESAVQPLVPLGSRGQFEGVPFEAIGFQIRTENNAEDGPDSWQEYLLYNPYRGYRYLTEYNGHWNFVHIAHAIPQVVSQSQVSMTGTKFQLYSRAVAQTTYVVGEFPWIVHVGDTVDIADFVAAPRILSSETTSEETVWSLGSYMSGPEIWKAFSLPGTATPASGTFANQPSPFAAGIGLWGTASRLALAAFVLALFFFGIGGQQVFRQTVTLASGAQVTPVFEVGGHESNLQLEAQNRGPESFYLHYSLVDQASGQAISFARDVGKEDRATVPAVKAGRYAVRMESEPPAAHFDLIVRRDVPSFGIVVIVLLLLLVPPVFETFRRSSFERDRWQGSSR